MTNKDSVAIVGIGGTFPSSPDLARFWSHIEKGHSTAQEAPAGRWTLPVEKAYDSRVGLADHVYSKRGCFVDEEVLSGFDGLDIDRKLLAGLDPVFRLLLATGRQAFDDAGTEGLDRARVGVILGNLALPSEKSSALARKYLGETFAEKVLGRPAESGEEVEPLNRYVAGLPAGVLAKALGLGGGSYTLDAACASSLYAIKLAVDELLSGRADAMLTGGVSRPDCFYTQMGFSQLRALSPTGVCSPFDSRGNGLVVGEGCGLFVLKRTSDAVKADDRIYGVIRGVGLSNDIGGSLLAPLSEGQLRAMRSAYEQAGWNPEDVDLIECHATGTPVGDAVEFGSLRTLWDGSKWDKGQCVIGSVKSNIGHTLTAAGSAATLKVLLAMKEETLPPTANFEAPPEKIDLAGGPFEVLRQGKDWKRRSPGTPRRAAVSAFGFGGINAHLLIEEWLGEERSASEPPVVTEAEPVAVVGMDARFGPWKSLDEVRHRVFGGAEIPPSAPGRWWGAEQSAWFKKQGLDAASFKGHYIKDLPIPSGRFRIPPTEMEEMLPQQLLMLKTAAGALEDAAIEGEMSTETGVFVGLGLDLNATNFTFRWSIAEKARDWAEELGLDLSEEELHNWIGDLRQSAGPALSANRTMGALGSIVASRIAREFRIGGPSFTLSSEDNSGIRALETAVRALQNRSLDRAIVGAVDMAGDLRSVLGSNAHRPFSPSGSCRPFDSKADGSIVGEGVAAVVLKRLSDAERDGDRIYSVIRGIGSTTGGGLDSLPTTQAYGQALERAYREADIDPASVSYLDAHGSGSPAEDRLEAEALSSFFAGEENRPVLGSSKEAFGHTGAASSLASLVKTSLCLHHEILPGLSCTENGTEEVKGFLLPKAPQYWLRNREDGPRRAALSSMSVDGNCSHLVLEEGPGTSSGSKEPRPLGPDKEALFAIEGGSAEEIGSAIEALRALASASSGIEDLARLWLKKRGGPSGENLALTLVSRNGEELLQQLDYAGEALKSNPESPIGGGNGLLPPFARDRIFFSPTPMAAEGKVAFVFPGSGNHYPGMGQALSARWPEIFRRQDGLNLNLRDQYQPRAFWNGLPAKNVNENHKAMIFGQVAHGTAVSDLVRSFGVEPSASIGYSLGESASLFSMGAWKARDLMLQRMNDSRLFTSELAGECTSVRQAWNLKENEKVDWVLGVVDTPAPAVKKALRNRKKVYLLIVNTPSECVIGGDRKAVERLVEKLACNYFPIEGVTTVHCDVAEPVAGPYHDLHLFETDAPKAVRFYSAALGRSYEVTTESAAEAILSGAVKGVDFPPAVENAYEDGARIFLEMGPGTSCTRMIGQILGDRPHLARSASVPGQDQVSTILRLLARLIAEGVKVDLGTLYGGELSTPAGKIQGPALPIGGAPYRVEKPRRNAKKAVAAPVARPKPTPAPAAPKEPVDMPKPTPIPKSAPPAVAQATANPLLEGLEKAAAMRSQAHETFLRFSADLNRTMTENLALQMSLIEQAMAGGEALPAGAFSAPVSAPTSTPAPEPKEVAFDREMCMEFAIGSIAKMLGPEFAEVDSYPTRVRLPDEPLMLVDRILSVEGEPRSMTSGRVVTEHDVTADRWYLDGSRIPTCIAVEAGQADLFLSGYLGIDFISKGKAVYRLLDAVVTFHRGLPVPGETIHYDIEIERFFRQDQTYLFRFNFEGTVNGEPLLSMKNGCAGFFTEEELAAGKGIVHTKLDLMPQPGILPEDWHDLTPMAVESYDEAQVNALYAGDLAACFGPLFAGLPLATPYTLPGGKLKLVDRVVELDPKGGRYGLGQIKAEMDIDPLDWFLTCHFVDDRVMPGTLMYECCMHTLRIYLLRMGWVGEEGATWCEPVPGVDSGLKCRGQVTETTSTVTYQVSIKELGYRPEPYAIVDALMFADGKPIVEIPNMSVRLSGLDEEQVTALWQGREALPVSEGGKKKAIYDYDSILAYAVGNPSEAFGEPYRVFDEERRIARLPGPPFQFIDRITGIDCEPWKLVAGGTVEAQYDVPEDAWYFAANRQAEMPFSVLLEIGLQPCGWLAAYLGSALTSEIDLCFRNLDGSAVQLRPVTAETGVLTMTAKMTRVASSGGMIIQNYDFEVRDEAGPVYKGDTVFGFFTKAALAQQVGVRDAVLYLPTEEEAARGRSFSYPAEAPFPEKKMRMVDTVELFVADGGPEALGFIRGTKKVDPEEWFFKAHFYQDPVCPGSLGLESFLQLLKVVAVERWGADAETRLQAVACGEKQSWNYRGQIIPDNETVTIEAVVTGIDEDQHLIKADGYLMVDGRVIYKMTDFTAKIL